MKHLIEEPPILVYPTLAKLLGVNKAIMLQQLHFLLGITEKAKSKYNFVDERWWVYNTYEQWRNDHFPWLSEITIRTLFNQLEEAGIVVSQQSVKNPSDRTKWYSINYVFWDEFISSLMRLKSSDGSCDENHHMDRLKSSDGYTETTTESTETTKKSDATIIEFSNSKSGRVTHQEISFDFDANTITDEDLPEKKVAVIDAVNSLIPKGKLTANYEALLCKKVYASIEGRNEVFPSPAALYDQDERFATYIRTVPTTLKQFNMHPTGSNFVKIICNYTYKKYGWLAYEEAHPKTVIPIIDIEDGDDVQTLPLEGDE